MKLEVGSKCIVVNSLRLHWKCYKYTICTVLKNFGYLLAICCITNCRIKSGALCLLQPGSVNGRLNFQTAKSFLVRPQNAGQASWSIAAMLATGQLAAEMRSAVMESGHALSQDVHVGRMSP